MDLETGQILGDYEILRVLGAGGMGKVYQVRNTLSHRVEAMKVLLPSLSQEGDLADRFLREIRISASLDHPNIAALRTAQRIGNQLVMVMEYVEGATLDALARSPGIGVGQAVGYMMQALSALSYAHSRGVTHRDIKPANIMLTPSETVKLMDFGIAKMATESKLTKTGMMVGSVYYMPPELIDGREMDARSDIYSLGITLYEIVTGQRPFNGDSEYKIMAAHLKELPKPPREIRHTLPAGLNEIILMAMAKEPAQRFQSADAFRAALSSVAAQGAGAMPATVAMGGATAAGGAGAVKGPAVPGPQPVAPVPPTAKKDRRLLYMVAGSVATIAVIAGAVVELPKYWGAHAGSGVGSGSASPIGTPAAGTKTAEDSTLTSHPAFRPDPLPDAGTMATPTPVPTNQPNVPSKTGPGETARGPAETARGAKPGAAEQKSQVAQAPVPSASPTGAGTGTAAQDQPAPRNAGAPVPGRAAQNQSPGTQASPEAPNAAEISELRDRAMLMGARISAVRASLQTLGRAQAQQGLGLRSDIVAAQERMLYQMEEAEASLRRGDAAVAKKRLEGAERDLEKLESFLGK